jgi:NADH:ubiquinone oxidoreductase subunit
MTARGLRYLAQQNGDKKYMADKPCKRGHVSLRVTATGSCVECIKFNERARYYADSNKTKEKLKKKYIINAEKIKARRKEWYQNNINEERSKAILKSREWRKNNPEHRNALKAKYMSDKAQRTPKWAKLNSIVKFYKECPKGYHVDHKLPLRGKKVSGLHVLENLQYLPAIENMRKNNKFLPA